MFFQGPSLPIGVTRSYFGAVVYEGEIWLFSSQAVYTLNPIFHTWTTQTFDECTLLSCPVIYQNKILLCYKPVDDEESTRNLVFKTYNISNNTFQDFENIPDIDPMYTLDSRCKSNRLFTIDMPVIWRSFVMRIPVILPDILHKT